VQPTGRHTHRSARKTGSRIDASITKLKISFLDAVYNRGEPTFTFEFGEARYLASMTVDDQELTER